MRKVASSSSSRARAGWFCHADHNWLFLSRASVITRTGASVAVSYDRQQGVDFRGTRARRVRARPTYLSWWRRNRDPIAAATQHVDRRSLALQLVRAPE